MDFGIEIDEKLAQEHLYLIRRGVRPIAFIGLCSSAAQTMLRASTVLESFSESGDCPFVIDRGDGSAEYGFAAAAWVVDLLRWIYNKKSPAPEKQRDRVLALLLGYSTTAVASYEERKRLHRFRPLISESPAQKEGPRRAAQ